MERVSVAHFQDSQEARLRFTEELRAQRERERQDRLLTVVDWLSAEKSSKIQQKELNEKRANFPTTTRWIFAHSAFRDWLSKSGSMNPVFWLSGIPGAGK